MKWAKFFVALAGAGLTIAAQNDIVLPTVVSQIVPIATAVLVYLVPNKPSY